MLPSRCGALGGSRRLTPHSSAASHFYLARFLAPWSRPASSDGRCPQTARSSSACCCNSTSSSTTTASSTTVGSSSGVDGDPAGVATCRGSGDVSGKDPRRGASSQSGSSNEGSCSTGGSDGDRSRSNSTPNTNSTISIGHGFVDGVNNGRGRSTAVILDAENGWGPRVEDTTLDNWRAPLSRPGSVVALGKFDALHRGHCALATAAAALAQDISAAQSTAVGDAVLLSFSGMGAVLGWPERLPLTAPQDRSCVLASWAAACAGADVDCSSIDSANQLCSVAPESSSESSAAPPAADLLSPRLRTLPFALIRRFSPEQFVALLAQDLGAAGVVAGRNYRFGYKAAGDAETLVRLGQQYSLRVVIVDLVTHPPDQLAIATEGATALGRISNDDLEVAAALDAAATGAAQAQWTSSSSSIGRVVISRGVGEGKGGGGGEVGAGSSEDFSSRVSSSRIRTLLERGEVESVQQLLGRKYRLVCDLRGARKDGADTTLAVSITDAALSRSDDDGSERSRTRGSHTDGTGDGGHRSMVCGPHCTFGEAGRLMVPSAAYQNQPPANGQYRALVQLEAARQFTEEGTGAMGSIGAAGEGVAAVRGVGGAKGGFNTACRVLGPACTSVTLSDSGLEVTLDGEMELQEIFGSEDGKVFLLVDFDACT